MKIIEGINTFVFTGKFPTAKEVLKEAQKKTTENPNINTLIIGGPTNPFPFFASFEVAHLCKQIKSMQTIFDQIFSKTQLEEISLIYIDFEKSTEKLNCILYSRN